MPYHTFLRCWNTVLFSHYEINRKKGTSWWHSPSLSVRNIERRILLIILSSPRMQRAAVRKMQHPPLGYWLTLEAAGHPYCSPESLDLCVYGEACTKPGCLNLTSKEKTQTPEEGNKDCQYQPQLWVLFIIWKCWFWLVGYFNGGIYLVP
jgi:hypothetical protein